MGLKGALKTNAEPRKSEPMHRSVALPLLAAHTQSPWAK